MLSNTDLHKLGMFISSKKHTPWVRGENDCCTIGMEWHDLRFGTNTVDQIKGKYSDLKGAIRVAKKIPLDKWFIDNGYTQILDENVIDGDIVMVRHNRFFFSAYIVLMGTAYGIQDEANGMSRHPLETIYEHTIWRI